MLLAAFGNALLFVFNLIPIPPLDGAKVIFPFLPRSLNGFAFMNQYGPVILLGLVLLTFLPMFSPLSYILSWYAPFLHLHFTDLLEVLRQWVATLDRGPIP